jgi:hypothetical protein
MFAFVLQPPPHCVSAETKCAWSTKNRDNNEKMFQKPCGLRETKPIAFSFVLKVVITQMFCTDMKSKQAVVVSPSLYKRLRDSLGEISPGGAN